MAAKTYKGRVASRLDGKKVASELLISVKKEVDSLKKKHVFPKIAVILVGEDPASKIYVRQKQKACEQVGIYWEQLNFRTNVTTKKLIETVEALNEDPKIHGVLVQLPLPKQVYTPDVMKAISPYKDVDGFTAYNIGKMFLSPEFEDLVPCTPRGVLYLLKYYKIPIEGQEVIMVGSSNIVGKPLATMLMNRKATVTVCNSKTRNLAFHTKRADILCVAVGKPNLITKDMVKKDAVVIDIGINRMPDGSLRGDTDFENVSKVASYITPIPGGVGPMTVACLMENVVRATKKQVTLRLSMASRQAQGDK